MNQIINSTVQSFEFLTNQQDGLLWWKQVHCQTLA